jgi:hypothetical protein
MPGELFGAPFGPAARCVVPLGSRTPVGGFPLKSTKVVNTMNQETHQKTPCSWPAVVLNRRFNFNHSFENEQRRWAMSRNMPLLSRFLSTAHAAVIVPTVDTITPPSTRKPVCPPARR